MYVVACILVGFFSLLAVYYALDERDPLTHARLAKYIIELWRREAIEIWEEEADGQW